jgi:glucose/arabinose dehydrogenase/cytochrome c2
MQATRWVRYIRAMKIPSVTLGGAGLCAILFAASAAGADADHGKLLFRQRCTVCHSAEKGDDGGAQGPSLAGVVGRPAASGQFSYTDALKASHLTWDPATLNRFLAAPGSVVPGTSMQLAVTEAADRNDLIAYFQSLPQPAAAAAGNDPGIKIPDVSRRSANWRDDAPGRTHRISVAALPAVFATESSRNRHSMAPRPDGAQLHVPKGFHVDTFATGLAGPRRMLLAANGDVLVTEMNGGKVSVLHTTPDGSRAAQVDTFASGLKQPFGLAFYPNAKNPKWLYVAETNRVIRYAYQTGDINPHAAAEVVVPQLPSGVGHSTRDIAFSADGRQMFVSVGSGSNVAETMAKKNREEIKTWEAQQGLGASWGDETNRAAVLVFDAASPGAPRNYATGIRNCVSLTMQPMKDTLWCTTNERDALGDDLVPDYSTKVAADHFYGWPWYYLGAHEDPRHKGERPDLAGKVTVPDVLYQAHSAALSMTFYVASAGNAAFPASYVGDAFVALHGSWNRSLRTGYKLVRIHMKNGEPGGDYEDFLTGFVVDDASVWGRPVATVQMPDGSLLLSEDGNNVIYRIAYQADKK